MDTQALLSPRAASDAPTGSMSFRTSKRGITLIHDPRYNKGTAFTQRERELLGLQGLLPPRVLSMDQQLGRIRRNFDAKATAIEKYIFLVGLQDRNETLFYRFVIDHLTEMMPIIYTPVVGEACRTFGHIFRRPRGLYISLKDKGRVRDVLRNWPVPDVSVIVVTDGERILGLGDLGAHGMGIPIGKLALYTACAGVSPYYCLPVTLDVGTDNVALRADPLYTGLTEPRMRGPEYDALIEEFVTAVQERFPNVLLQFEDFKTENAIRLLGRYRDRLCCFNDDIQGTAAVVLTALLSACRLKGEPLREQRLLFHGAGASATGVANLIVSAMRRQGLGEPEARRRIWFVDSHGLVVASRGDLAAHKKPFAHVHEPVADLAAAVRALAPTGLIGLSTQGGAFTEDVVRALRATCARPIVFALSNPTANSECTAEQAYRWTDGRALFASGSPFDPVTLNGATYVPGQANNAFIFPGLGLGIVLSKARRVTDAMFHEAARTVAESLSDADLARGMLLPPLAGIRGISLKIAAAVARLAAAEGLAQVRVPDDAERWVEEQMYKAVYPDYEPA
jgi:malate dehydrogenase (oxaloacetate-decarboxylating)(NADP+)